MPIGCLNYYSGNHSELIQSSGSVSTETQRLRAVGNKVLNTLNDLNPNSQKDIVYPSLYLIHRKDSFYAQSRNTMSLETKLKVHLDRNLL